MLVRQLKEILETIVDDADIILQIQTPEGLTTVCPILRTRKSKVPNKEGKIIDRLVLINNNLPKLLEKK